MAKVRDLGINVIPMTMRPLEIGPGAGRDGVKVPVYWAACANETNCAACAQCDPPSNAQETSCNPSGAQRPTKKKKPAKKAPSKPSPASKKKTPSKKKPSRKYRASGFTQAAVLQLKQQLRAQLQKETDH